MFAMAVMAGNVLALVRGSLRKAQGQKVEGEVSGYYLANEVAGDYRNADEVFASRPMDRLANSWMLWPSHNW